MRGLPPRGRLYSSAICVASVLMGTVTPQRPSCFLSGTILPSTEARFALGVQPTASTRYSCHQGFHCLPALRSLRGVILPRLWNRRSECARSRPCGSRIYDRRRCRPHPHRARPVHVRRMGNTRRVNGPFGNLGGALGQRRDGQDAAATHVNRQLLQPGSDHQRLLREHLVPLLQIQRSA